MRAWRWAAVGHRGGGIGQDPDFGASGGRAHRTRSGSSTHSLAHIHPPGRGRDDRRAARLAGQQRNQEATSSWAETFYAVANRLLRQHVQMVGLNPSFTLLDHEDSADLQCKGFHDEPLKGKLQGQRSVRLNRAYRAIYVEHETGEVELIEVLEVNKHEY